MLGFHEILIIIFVVVLIFGAPKLPQLGDGLGRAVRNFRRAVRGDNEIDVTPPREDKRVPPKTER